VTTGDDMPRCSQRADELRASTPNAAIRAPGGVLCHASAIDGTDD